MDLKSKLQKFDIPSSCPPKREGERHAQNSSGLCSWFPAEKQSTFSDTWKQNRKCLTKLFGGMPFDNRTSPCIVQLFLKFRLNKIWFGVTMPVAEKLRLSKDVRILCRTVENHPRVKD